MGEKKNGSKNGGDGEKKEKGSSTIVLKFDCFCEGCATKILKHIYEFEGVEKVKTEMSSNKVTVIGTVDPIAMKEKLVRKIKNVDLVSPQPKKDNNKEEKKEKKQDSDNKPEKKTQRGKTFAISHSQIFNSFQNNHISMLGLNFEVPSNQFLCQKIIADFEL
ncbi:heavy metal-associated isoprenylated plant protein 3-like [Hibiscus syriacus]|uniref:heavy metal-associated isoprenylated plant protein 3-like n=1 Tax=Hibiscus syriacus TaxID=106335 RepID=UPI0019232FBE|nr:heavy metal-associated isoprenylated plant protein 3-like [Hibiscus syriacus]